MKKFYEYVCGPCQKVFKVIGNSTMKPDRKTECKTCGSQAEFILECPSIGNTFKEFQNKYKDTTLA